MLAFVIPFALIFINRKKSEVSPVVSKEMSDVEPTTTDPSTNVTAKDFPVV